MRKTLSRFVRESWLYPLGPLLYATAVVLFLVTRYSAGLSDTDTFAFYQFINNMSESGKLISGSLNYGQGYGFPSFSTFLVTLTGLDASLFLKVVYSVLGLALVAMAFTFFSIVTGSVKLASLSAFFVLLQPEILFVLLRGNHEKVTLALVILAMLVLVKAPLASNSLAVYGKFMVIFYLFSYSLITTNVGFASSWIFAVATSCAVGYLISWLLSHSEAQAEMKRLFYISVSCLIFVFMFVFYLYLPSLYFVQALSNVLKQATVLLLGAEISTNPYDVINFAWGNPFKYLGLTIFNWTVLLMSFAMWAKLGVGMITNRFEVPRTPLLMLWLFYGAFGFQLFLAAASDQTGAIGGNFQIRMFPIFMLFAIPLAVLALDSLVLNVRREGSLRVITGVFLPLCFLWFAVGGLWKATNEPNLSNNWVFHVALEKEGIQWAADHLMHSKMWVDFDQRLKVIDDPVTNSFKETNYFDGPVIGKDTRYVMISRIIEERSRRIGMPLPNVRQENRVYDNGFTEIYQFRPRTIYQD